ncbi:MAG TPA: hypothetical protein VFF30_01960 [Nitrososphaerales archaeon]|nr:hypothetical protein [Nitrososphaerales archaeon]
MRAPERPSSVDQIGPNCPKCGGLLVEEKCNDCHFSHYTALTRDEAKEITVAG